MKAEEKLMILEALMSKGNVSIGQVVLENNAPTYFSCDKNLVKPVEETMPAKEAIMEYVGRLKPMVKEEYQENYDDLWLGILNLKEVKLHIYNKGKQQDTCFNRNLVAQIIHQISDRVFVASANNAMMAEHLEPEKGVQHPVRLKLGESPDKPIKASVEAYLSGNL